MSTTLGSGKIKRWGYVLGIVIVFLALSITSVIRNDAILSRMVDNARPYFYDLQAYDGAKPIPSIVISGPNGTQIDLGSYRGKFVLLNLWATWCAPCVKELPTVDTLKKYYKKNDRDWVVLAVSVDTQKNMNDISSFLNRYKIGDVALYHDVNMDLQNSLSFSRLPTSFVIGPDGRILYKITGGSNWFQRDVINFLDAITKRY